MFLILFDFAFAKYQYKINIRTISDNENQTIQFEDCLCVSPYQHDFTINVKWLAYSSMIASSHYCNRGYICGYDYGVKRQFQQYFIHYICIFMNCYIYAYNRYLYISELLSL